MTNSLTVWQAQKRTESGDYLGRLQKHLVADMPHTKEDHTQSHTREDVGIVALAWVKDTPIGEFV